MIDAINRAESVLQDLYARAQREPVDSERVHIALQALDMDSNDSDGKTDSEELKVRTARGAVRARGANQTEYLSNIRTHDLTFGIGPAGTGKTYLAVAARSRRCNPKRSGASCWFGRRSRRASAWVFFPATCRRRSIPTCVRCTTRSTKCWVLNGWPS